MTTGTQKDSASDVIVRAVEGVSVARLSKHFPRLHHALCVVADAAIFELTGTAALDARAARAFVDVRDGIFRIAEALSTRTRHPPRGIMGEDQ